MRRRDRAIAECDTYQQANDILGIHADKFRECGECTKLYIIPDNELGYGWLVMLSDSTVNEVEIAIQIINNI